MTSPPDEIRRLKTEINRHNRLYYVDNQPEISDAAFDQLLKRLAELEKRHPECLTPDSPTQRVGGEATGDFQRIPHDPPLLSLENTYSRAEVEEWEKRLKKIVPALGDFHVELKIDGLSLAVTYERGRLARAATRGDGETGEDVTLNARTIRSLPLSLGEGAPPVLEVRGEVYVAKKDFEQFNRRGASSDDSPPFANTRNFAAGSLRQKNPRLTAERPLRFSVHSFGHVQGAHFTTQEEFLRQCRSWGLPVDSRGKRCATLEEALCHCTALENERDAFELEADGAVIKVNTLAIQDQLGATFKSPRWAVAYKFPAAQGVTQVLAVDYSVGRTGALTPVAALAPVALGGVTVTSASLHNADEIDRLGLRVGDWVTVERAGEVIPKVLAVHPERRTGGETSVPRPTQCPSCGSSVDKRKPDEVAWRCSNNACPAQVEKTILHFASRDALDIDGLGEAAVSALRERGYLNSPADLFSLRRDQLLSLEGFKDKKADNLLQAISEARHRPLDRFILALGIPEVGEKSARQLAEHFGTLDALAQAPRESLLALPDVGPVTAEAVVTFFQEPRTRQLLSQFRDQGVSPVPWVASAGALPLKGQRVVITGTLAMSRREAQRRVREAGGETSESVSSQTTFVVTGENPGSKRDKAATLGVEMINEQEFRRRLGLSQ